MPLGLGILPAGIKNLIFLENNSFFGSLPFFIFEVFDK